MCTFEMRPNTKAWCWALVSTLLITACGGGKDPILGMDNRISLTPSVSATAPLARTPVVTGVAINTRVTATLNKAMSPDSISTNTFTLQCPAGAAIESSVSYDANSRVATLSPAAHLPVSTLCTATITTGAKDTDGIALPLAFVWSFETGSSTDSTPPTVTQQVPAQDAVAMWTW